MTLTTTAIGAWAHGEASETGIALSAIANSIREPLVWRVVLAVGDMAALVLRQRR